MSEKAESGIWHFRFFSVSSVVNLDYFTTEFTENTEDNYRREFRFANLTSDP